MNYQPETPVSLEHASLKQQYNSLMELGEANLEVISNNEDWNNDYQNLKQ